MKNSAKKKTIETILISVICLLTMILVGTAKASAFDYTADTVSVVERCAEARGAHTIIANYTSHGFVDLSNDIYIAMPEYTSQCSCRYNKETGVYMVTMTLTLLGDTDNADVVYISVDEHEHEWSEAEVVKAPGYGFPGLAMRTCECGAVQDEILEQLSLPSDVEPNSYYEVPIAWALDTGVADPDSDGLMHPENPCTRGEAIQYIWRSMGSPEPNNAVRFTDVPSDDSFSKAVAWATEAGITNGVSATEFAPNDTCTRAQIVTFLWRACKRQSLKSAFDFADVVPDSWYADAVAWATAKGITNGVSATKFAPGGLCTRAHILTFLYRNDMAA